VGKVIENPSQSVLTLTPSPLLFLADILSISEASQTDELDLCMRKESARSKDRMKKI
jgi:hypothetical protein